MPDFFQMFCLAPIESLGLPRLKRRRGLPSHARCLISMGCVLLKGMKRFPPQRLVAEKWAIYRHLQVRFLFALDLYARFGTALAEPMSAANEQHIEHDVLDAQYMLIGVLQGALATQEKKLQRWFKLLQPDGLLVHLGGATAWPTSSAQCRTSAGTSGSDAPNPQTPSPSSWAASGCSGTSGVMAFTLGELCPTAN